MVEDLTDELGPRALTANGGTFTAGTPRVSLDGQLVAFRGPPPDPLTRATGEPIFSATYLIGIDGNDQRLIVRGAWPWAWLPDGRLLVVDETTGQAHAVDLDSTEAELIAAYVAEVSPDGSLVVAQAVDSATGVSSDALVLLAGTPIASLPGVGGTWSPDGSALVVADLVHSAIVVVGRDGSIRATYQVASVIGGDLRPRWRPAA